MRNDKCNNCRFDVGSYHCLDCKEYDGKIADLKSFCSYCQYYVGSEECNNCVWKEKTLISKEEKYAKI